MTITTRMAMILLVPTALPAITSILWLLQKDRSAFPYIRVFLCFLFVILFLLYAELGPFYNVVRPDHASSAQEYFGLLAKEERPITIILWSMFLLQFVLIGKVLYTTEESSVSLVFSFSILAIYWSFFALFYAIEMLYVGGID